MRISAGRFGVGFGVKVIYSVGFGVAFLSQFWLSLNGFLSLVLCSRVCEICLFHQRVILHRRASGVSGPLTSPPQPILIHQIINC